MKYSSFFCICAFLINSAPLLALPAPTFRTVAYSGQQAPGTPLGARFGSTFSIPTINSSGFTSFHALLQLNQSIVTTSNDNGVWSEGSGMLDILARKGDPVPGLAPRSTFSNLFGFVPIISDGGDTAWSSNFLESQPGGDTIRTAIWSGSAGAVVPAAATGHPAPTLPSGTVFSSLRPIAMSGQGELTFVGDIVMGETPLPNSHAIWIGKPGELSMAVRAGDQAPGLTAGTSFNLMRDPRINNSGEIAFVSELVQGVPQGLSVWKGSPASIELVARSGQQAPGIPAGGAFDINSNLVGFNSRGQVAFRAGLMESVPAGVNASNNAGVWSEGSGILELIARRGDQAPGMPAGNPFRDFGDPLISDEGHIAFVASTGTTAPGTVGIWSDVSGALQLVAAEQMPAPGIPNASFIGFVGRSFISLAGNSAGHLAFTALVVGSGINSSNNSGLWAQDQNGRLRLLVREGDLFEVAPGIERTVSNISIATGSGGGDGRARSYNDDYQLAFHLFFTDGSNGIFVTQVIPEPGGRALFAIGILLALYAARCEKRCQFAATQNQPPDERPLHDLALIKRGFSRKFAVRASCQREYGPDGTTIQSTCPLT